MADNGLAPLNAAVAARMAGRVPTPEQLRFAAKYRWPHGMDLSLWATGGGSENHPIYEAVTRADWPFLAALARWWSEYGLFGSEAGCDNRYYSSGVIEVMLLARRELLKAGAAGEAEAIRLAVRAHLACLALAAIPSTRMRDELHTGSGVITGVRPAPKRGKGSRLPGLAVAPAGNRFHGPGSRAGGLTTDDAGAELLAAALTDRETYGLELLEAATLTAVVHADGGPALESDRNAARVVSSWLYGTLAGWRLTLRRTDQGAERVFWAGNRGPNTNKPAQAVGQVRPSGLCRALRPASKNAPGWSEGWTVTEEGDVYTASCAGGTASLPKLGGETLWTVEIENGEVKFL